MLREASSSTELSAAVCAVGIGGDDGLEHQLVAGKRRACNVAVGADGGVVREVIPIVADSRCKAHEAVEKIDAVVWILCQRDEVGVDGVLLGHGRAVG